MKINEICKLTGLTKKAIEYYQIKDLIKPTILENGYREFTECDVEQLMTIAVLKKLELTVDEIKQVLESKDRNSVLMRIKHAKQVQTKAKLERIKLIGQMARGEDIRDRINVLEQKCTIREKLLSAFPGYYGRYISFHFGRFLNEPIKTDQQKSMYDIIISFLDNMESIEVPEELQEMFNEADSYMDDEVIESMSLNMQTAINDFEAYWENNHESITKYVEYRKSEEYKNSLMPKFKDWFKKFAQASGYNDVFIPAMRKLSPSYNEYYEEMLKFNTEIIKKIPEIEQL